MIKARQSVDTTKKRRHKGRAWLWAFVVILIIGAAAWFTYDKGLINWGYIANKVIPSGEVEQVIESQVIEEVALSSDAVETADVVETVEMQPACAVVEKLLLQGVVSDELDDYRSQENSAQIYDALAKYGCAENSTFFADMAARKRVIADGLKAVYGYEEDSMTEAEYLYSDEKICQTIENRVMKNINTSAYRYEDFLNNANTYSVLYEYGCCANKAAYMRAAIRELGVAVALMPTDKMTREEIITVVEICKRLGVAEAAHLMLQRLKARGYDMEFLLEMEDIIHGIR